MTRTRSLLLVGVLALVAIAVFVGAQGSKPAASKTDALAGLRTQVGLAPCPTGIGPELPDLTLRCLGGGPAVKLRGAPTGLPTLVNLYGSWCGPCAKEMPLLVAYAKKAAGKVALLGIDTQDEERLGLSFAKDVGQTWPALVDEDGAVLRTYSSGAPATLFVNAEGKVVFVKIGAFKDLAEIVELTTDLGVTL